MESYIGTFLKTEKRKRKKEKKKKQKKKVGQTRLPVSNARKKNNSPLPRGLPVKRAREKLSRIDVVW